MRRSDLWSLRVRRGLKLRMIVLREPQGRRGAISSLGG